MNEYDDIYAKLTKQGLLKKESDIKNKKIRNELKNKNEILNRVRYKLFYNRNLNNDDEDDNNNECQIITVKEEKNLKIDKLLKNKSNDNYVNYLKNKYSVELNEYEYIESSNIKKLKLGGYIRYIDINEDIKWGGILIKINNINKLSKCVLSLKNTNNDIWKIKFIKYYIFYKSNATFRLNIKKDFNKLFVKYDYKINI